MILWDTSLEVYDWLDMVICHLHADYMSPEYFLLCQVHS